MVSVRELGRAVRQVLRPGAGLRRPREDTALLSNGSKAERLFGPADGLPGCHGQVGRALGAAGRQGARPADALRAAAGALLRSRQRAEPVASCSGVVVQHRYVSAVAHRRLRSERWHGMHWPISPSHRSGTSLRSGLVIPGAPAGPDAGAALRRAAAAALSRYYLAAGAGGLAVGVHTTQFEIRDPKIGLYKPVLELAIAGHPRARPATTACRSWASPASAARPSRPSARRRWRPTSATTRAC